MCFLYDDSFLVLTETIIKILMEGGKIGNYTGIGVKYRKWGGGEI